MTSLMRRIDRRVEGGASLDEIEAELLDPSTLDEERASAAWLYAWLRTEQRGAVAEQDKVIPLQPRHARRSTADPTPRRRAGAALGAAPRAVFAATSAAFVLLLP